MTRQLVEEAFGSNNTSIDLYKDVLQCPKDASNAQLRKAYYKRARDFHPDKNKEESAKLQFQAISFAYNYLKDPERRKDYDEEGILPDENDMGDNGDDDNDKPNDWKAYFDMIFGKLSSTKKIDDFELKYKMSLEEEADVLKYYEQFQGNLVKCLEFVMLSQDRDVKRWMEDYIQPAIDEGKVTNYEANLKSSIGKIDKKLAREQKKNQSKQKKTKTKVEEDEEGEEDDEEEVAIDEDETESEDSEDDKRKSKKKKAAKPAAKKAKPTVTKRRRQVMGGCGPSDGLIAAIRGRQNSRNSGGSENLFASLGARYGVDMGDDDPLDDAAFAKIQSKLKKKKGK
ncbi:unnamed protein product [Cylindrotheca closterium]|uniref:J domain-containing protein n=1 Tax=Cylindrotheca closterium TaxID=2856 RepID=A0AAD2JGB9_9STRA|nr:unnamed protein product [Cylindrotheca closterium]